MIGGKESHHAEGETTLEATAQPLCTLCGNTGELCYPELQDRHFDAPGTWSHLRCPTCHLEWLNPQPSTNDLAQLYADYYTHAAQEEGSLFVRAILRGIPAAKQGYSDFVDGKRERALGRVLSWLGPLAEMGKRGTLGLDANERGALLDFGCGDGAFLKHMRGLGWSVSGVEQDPQAAQVAHDALGGDPIHATLTDAKAAATGGYDVITLSHVIEHLLDPVATLRECLACLRPGGRLVVATPNTESRAHARFGRNWLHLDPPRHIYLFNASTLTEVTRQAGFHVENVETPASSSHFVYQASMLIEEQGALPGIRVEAVTAWGVLESALFWFWEYALNRFGLRCGEELLLTAVRPKGVAGEDC